MSKLWDNLSDEQRSRLSSAAFIKWNYSTNREAGENFWNGMSNESREAWNDGTKAIIDELVNVAEGK